MTNLSSDAAGALERAREALDWEYAEACLEFDWLHATKDYSDRGADDRKERLLGRMSAISDACQHLSAVEFGYGRVFHRAGSTLRT